MAEHSDFRERILLLRSQSGLGQEETAYRIGVSSRTYQRWEAGYMPTPKNLQKISNFFGCNFDWLQTGAGNAFTEENSVISSATSGTKVRTNKKFNVNEATDIEKLRQIVISIETWLDDKQRRLSPEKKADLITLLYKHFIETKKEVEDQTVVEYLRLVS